MMAAHHTPEVALQFYELADRLRSDAAHIREFGYNGTAEELARRVVDLSNQIVALTTKIAGPTPHPEASLR